MYQISLHELVKEIKINDQFKGLVNKYNSLDPDKSVKLQLNKTSNRNFSVSLDLCFLEDEQIYDTLDIETWGFYDEKEYKSYPPMLTTSRAGELIDKSINKLKGIIDQEIDYEEDIEL